MSSSMKKHVLKRGFDIPFEGDAEKSISDVSVTRFAVQPPNYRGIAPIPKLLVKIGDHIQAGDAIFYDKSNPDILYVAPVSGEIIEVHRGEKRAIVEIVILADNKIEYRQMESMDVGSADAAALRKFFRSSGLWPLINQRPYDIVAEDIEPSNIFISTFDTAPLAPDLSFVLDGRESEFQIGLDALSKMTTGKVYLGIDGRRGAQVSDAFAKASGVEKHSFVGPHPCGNVGVQIHHVAPMGLKDKVWTLTVQDVMTIGSVISKGRYDARRVIALTGAELDRPHYVRSYMGANVGELLKDVQVNEHSRIISGNLLSGQKKTENQYLDAKEVQLTVIREGDFYRMFGWLSPVSPSPTNSKSFINGWFKKRCDLRVIRMGMSEHL